MAQPTARPQNDVNSADASHPGISRRRLLQGAAGLTAAAAVAPLTARAADEEAEQGATRGRIKQSVAHWCFDPMEVEELAQHAKRLGIRSVELVDPKHFQMLKDNGLVCALARSHGFVRGMCNTEYHAECLKALHESIDACAEYDFPNVITFSGMAEDIPDDVGLENTVKGLKQIIGQAEKKKVNICLEALNTRVTSHPMKGHPGYMADNVEWCIEVCKRVGSPRMKLLFDIYHVQIMQGDLITRIKELKEYIGHYHTAGVPGRGEIDHTQEIYYPAVMNAILETGFEGYVAQEFIPTHQDKVASLARAAQICDV